MADSVVKICNIALSNLGANLITGLKDGTVESQLCSSLWDNVRRSVLRLHPWNFAIKRIELAREDSTPAFGYRYVYPLPSDSLRVILVESDQDYKIEQKKVLTNSETCFIKYVFDNEDIGAWDDCFRDLIAARLRVDLAFGITRSNTALNLAIAIYQDKLKIAKAVDASEDIADPFGHYDSSLLGVR